MYETCGENDDNMWIITGCMSDVYEVVSYLCPVGCSVSEASNCIAVLRDEATSECVAGDVDIDDDDLNPKFEFSFDSYLSPMPTWYDWSNDVSGISCMYCRLVTSIHL